MDPEALEPYGRALLAYFEGDPEAELLLRRDDGFEAALPVAGFFRDAASFSPIEKRALDECTGRVLDIGAGTGLHSLVLQSRGDAVTAIDLCPQAVAILRRRGVRDGRESDVFAFGGPGPESAAFDTLLMLGHGLGIVGDLRGLDRLLEHARGLLNAGGRLLLDSLDVRKTDLREHLDYHEKNRKAGRYVGRTRLQLEHAGNPGPWCEWLHVDPETLTDRAELAGWKCAILLQQDSGDYLARLTPDHPRS